MIADPCLPVAVHHSAGTINAWIGWGKAHPLWHWQPSLPACAKAAVLGLPLLTVPGAVPIPTQPVLTLPGGPFWSGETGGFPGASYGGFAPGAFGPGAFGAGAYTSGLGPADLGWGTTPGPAAAGLIPLASLTAFSPPVGTSAAWANLVPQQMAQVRPELPGVVALGSASPPIGTDVSVPTVFSPGVPDTVQPVPAPDGVWVLLPALVGMTLVRKRSTSKDNRHG